jgi:hypothetical protein
VIYAALLERLEVPEGEKPEDVRKAFDNELGITAWATPGKPMKAERETDPDAPSWWTGEEDASQAFLSSMGVVFPNG